MESVRTTSSSPSTLNVEGSGIGPSMTHLLDSYLVRMKFSIFLIIPSGPFDASGNGEGQTRRKAHGLVQA